MEKTSKYSWMIASVLILINGILHLQGIFFTDDLNPAKADLIPLLQSTGIQMDASASFWNLWIGFNALFSAGLIFFGSVILYLSAKYFTFLKNLHFVLLLTIIINAFIVWIGYNYLISAFTISLSVPLVLYIVGYVTNVMSVRKRIH